tara:strand:+ start:19511 stop:19963 length:453 start_codon:yes stop_codon:yes gene_type:complete
MNKIHIIKHGKGAPGLRILGLGPNLRILRGHSELQNLLNRNTFWAKNRTKKFLQRMLKESSVAISLWEEHKMIGFGRALSDGVYRAVLWDIVVDKNYQNKGYGKMILNNLINSKALEKVDKIYIMTTHCQDFYKKNGFKDIKQKLLLYTN